MGVHHEPEEKRNIGKMETDFLYDSLCTFNQLGVTIQHLQELREKLENFRDCDDEDKTLEVEGYELYAMTTAIRMLGDLTTREVDRITDWFGMLLAF